MKIPILLYIALDYVAAWGAWAIFFIYRKTFVENNYFTWDLLYNRRLAWGLTIIPIAWLLLHTLAGSYGDIYRKSRIAELQRTFVVTIIGCFVLFFAAILDDYIADYTDYYRLFLTLFSLQIALTLLTRMTVLTKAKRQIETQQVGYNTIIIGGNRKATELYEEIIGSKRALGYRFCGFVEANGKNPNRLEKHLPLLGKLDDLPDIVAQYRIEEVIIAVETSEHPRLNDIINRLAGQQVVIKIIPDMYDILAGSVRMNHVLGAVLIEIYPDIMPAWERNIKRGFDIVVSAMVLLLLSPLYAYLALRVKLSSPGPIFYLQERVGRGSQPFNIIKFRSMSTDAEKDGPALSSESDPRITSFGKIMRKWRLDEIPQFYNVLRGDMSLVGPRPERQYYIHQIVKQAPAYRHLLKVQPGITSWGMVKFGYAENVSEMIIRMKYDLLYIENMSLVIDFKIMIYTVLILLQGKGK